MSTVDKVAKNTGVLLVGNLLFRLISLVVVIYLAKYLGVDEFGKYNFVFAYIAFFGIVIDFGLSEILVREMSRDTESMAKMLGNAYIIKIILSVFSILLSISLISLMDYPVDTTTYVYLISFTLLFISFSDNCRSVYQTTLKMEYDIIAKLISKIVSASLIFFIIAMHGTLYQLMLVFLFSEVLKALLNYFFVKRFVRVKFEIDLTLWKHLFKEALPIAFSSVFLIIYHRIDVLMLSIMIGDNAVGLYSAAYKLCEPLGLVPYAIVISLFPVMSRAFTSSKDTLIKYYEMGFKFLVILMLPITVGTALIADRIILLIYDQSFAGSIVALEILIWSVFLVSVNLSLTSLLTSINKQGLNTLSMGVCVVANILLNYLVIPKYSYYGASITTVVTELILLFMSLYFVSTNLVTPGIFRIFVKPMLACLLMAMPVYYLNNFVSINLFLIVISGALTYGVALVVLRIFSSEETKTIRRVLKI
ncbi:flippase [Methanococcoides seepicolus]|uniref:Flippase n=1 Tax=Methanococcoides seepicolus TaxID=2828780 RepID=A0A9E5DBA2_9EURY|nr:flippase [Methanococcoides seepicolus]MCM1986712.1 flippase [Methanococcoides seepicolus]